MTGSEFDRGIAVERRSDGVYNGHLDGSWRVGGGINGGLLLAATANALRQTFADEGHPDPISISAYYLSAARGGPATFTTDVVRQGRSMSTGTASLSQDEDGQAVERVRALATYGDLNALPEDVHAAAVEPQLPDVEKCVGTNFAASRPGEA